MSASSFRVALAIEGIVDDEVGMENSEQKRVARTAVIFAHFGDPEDVGILPDQILACPPPVTQSGQYPGILGSDQPASMMVPK